MILQINLIQGRWWIEMEKLIIAGRRNWDKEVYVRFKVGPGILKKVEEMLGEIDPNITDFGYITTEDIPPKYSLWKDELFIVSNKKEKIEIKIIFGEKIIHMLVKCPNYKYINKILHKYAKFADTSKFITKKK